MHAADRRVGCPSLLVHGVARPKRATVPMTTHATAEQIEGHWGKRRMDVSFPSVRPLANHAKGLLLSSTNGARLTGVIDRHWPLSCRPETRSGHHLPRPSASARFATGPHPLSSDKRCHNEVATLPSGASPARTTVARAGRLQAWSVRSGAARLLSPPASFLSDCCLRTPSPVGLPRPAQDKAVPSRARARSAPADVRVPVRSRARARGRGASA